MAQASKGNRRGDVFSVRVTPEERARLDALQARGGGPRALGPWLVWAALDRAGGARTGHYHASAALPDQVPMFQAGHYPVDQAGHYPSSPSSGTTGSRRRAPPLSERLILDLCGGSGSWGRPYEEAGYRVVKVTLPDSDVRVLPAPASPVWGILAAPPCDQFSLARNGWEGRGAPRDFVRGMACVNAVLRIVHQCKPRWWALENPVGLLGRWLGVPRDVWDPCDFGHPWTKRTAIWGDYAIPRRGPFVAPLGGGPFCEVCDPERRKTTWCNDAGHRAVTPQGFARAFFRANP